MGAVEVSWPAEGVAVLLVDNGPRNFVTWSLNDPVASRRSTFYIESFSKPDAVDRARAAHAANDSGATSAEVFGVSADSS